MSERARLLEGVEATGLGPEARRRVAALAERCDATLDDAGAAPGRRAFYVPGRVEVLGKHTDYAGGRSLLAAVERGFCMVGAPREDGVVRVTDARTGERVELGRGGDEEGWPTYPATVARRVAANFPGAPRGAELAFASDLPQAAGMSSSSALMIATFLTISALDDLPARAEYRENVDGVESLAEYLASVENGSSYRGLAGERGVGTQGGSEDHTAILCGRAGALVRYAFAPTRFEGVVPFPEGYVLAFAASGVRAEKTAGARDRYNQASARARALVELWNRECGRADPNLAAALRSAPDAAERMRSLVRAAPDPDAAALGDRLEQFVAESEEIVPAAAEALSAGRLEEFGSLVDRSQALSEWMLHNQVAETVHLAQAARRLGAAAASAFGAGFGGSVWALVEAGRVEAFLAEWRRDYERRFRDHSEGSAFFHSLPGPPARSILDPS